MATLRSSAPIYVTALFGLVVAFAAPSRAQNPGTALAGGAVPLPPMTNPPGDIPDRQVFITYHSQLGFSIKVPEGWARRSSATGFSFRDRYDALAVSVTHAAAAPTPASASRNQADTLRISPDAVRVSKIEAVSTPAGPAVRITYSSNSAPDTVTGKAIRLQDEQYLYWKNGRLATLTLSAPFGADNADQWRLMSRSFRWH